jgi:hypothetical protein
MDERVESTHDGSQAFVLEVDRGYAEKRRNHVAPPMHEFRFAFLSASEVIGFRAIFSPSDLFLSFCNSLN